MFALYTEAANRLHALRTEYANLTDDSTPTLARRFRLSAFILPAAERQVSRRWDNLTAFQG